MFRCPHCDQPAISALRKMALGPAWPTACRSCGRKVGVPYSSALLFPLAYLATSPFAFFTPSPPLGLVAGLGGLLVAALLQIAWVPLEAREGAASRVGRPPGAPAVPRPRLRFTVRGLMLAVA